MNKKKGKLFSLCVATAALSCLGALVWQSASADDGVSEGKFYMANGASIRIAEDYSGIRWKTTVEKTWFDANIDEAETATFGTLVAPKGVELDYDTYKAGNSDIVNVEVGYKSSTDGDIVFYSVINYDELVNQLQGTDTEKETKLQQAYALELNAISYVLINGTEVKYATAGDNARSAKLVANAALYAEDSTVQGDNKTKAQKYQGTSEDYELDEELAVDLSEAASAQTVSVEHTGTIDYVAIGAKKLSATVDGENITIAANELSSFAKAGPTNFTVVNTDGGVHNYPCIAATKLIDEASDLAIFNVGGYQKIVEDDASEYWVINYNTRDDKSTLKSQDGYYLVTKDIDASDYIHEFSVNRTAQYGNVYTGGPTDLVNWNYDADGDGTAEQTLTKEENLKLGLTGTFDGNGHRITGMTLAGYGLFGYVHPNGVIKDVAFMDVKFQEQSDNTTTWHNGQGLVLAFSIYDATIENVYVQVSEASATYAASCGTALAQDILASTVKNCLIEMPEIDARFTAYGSLTRTWYGRTIQSLGEESFENVYVVSKEPLSVTATTTDSVLSTTTIIDGDNIATDGTAHSGVDGYVSTASIYTRSGIKRFETTAALDAYFAENSSALSAFEGSTWTIGNGKLQWGDEYVIASTKIENFSAHEDDAVITQETLQSVFGGTNVELVSAKQNGKTLTVSQVDGSADYKVLGITPNFIRLDSGHIDGVDYAYVNMDVKVDGTEVNKAVGIKAYSRIIDEASDLTMFTMSVTKVTLDEAITSTGTGSDTLITEVYDYTNLKASDGYYILTQNLDASDVAISHGGVNFSGYHTYNQKWNVYQAAVLDPATGKYVDFTTYTGLKCYDLGLTGTFDGNGYTISGIGERYGLFGWIGNTGWVRNVAFVDTFPSGISFTNTPVLAEKIFKNAKLTNLYVQGSTGTRSGGATGGYLAGEIYPTVTMENCILEVNTAKLTVDNALTGGNSYGSLFSDVSNSTDPGNFDSGNNTKENSTIKNVYVISTVQLAYTYTVKNSVTTVTMNYDAENRAKPTTGTNYGYVYGVKRYDSVEDMIANAQYDGVESAANDYASFSSDYWTVADGGIPVWKNLE